MAGLGPSGTMDVFAPVTKGEVITRGSSGGLYDYSVRFIPF